jgi:lactosylceramide 4-alpha-galactosyltransferase
MHYKIDILQTIHSAAIARMFLRPMTEMTREECSGIAVLPPSVFYSIDYKSWELFFDESRSDEFLKKVEGSNGVHLSNKFSSHKKITVGSEEAYGLLAQKYCPGVYCNCGPVF